MCFPGYLFLNTYRRCGFRQTQVLELVGVRRSPTKMPASSLDAYANHADSSSKADMTPGALDALSHPNDLPCHRSDSQTSELRLLESEERTHAQVHEVR